MLAWSRLIEAGGTPMNKILLTLLVGLMLAVGVSNAYAGPLEDAADAYKRSDYATAMRLLRPLAEQGNAAAQSNLGFMYLHGLIVLPNRAQV
jgi:uncharacterized protein